MRFDLEGALAFGQLLRCNFIYPCWESYFLRTINQEKRKSFKLAGSIALETTMLFSLLRSRLKYLNSYMTYWQSILYSHAQVPQDELYYLWLFPDFVSSRTTRFAISQFSWMDCLDILYTHYPSHICPILQFTTTQSCSMSRIIMCVHADILMTHILKQKPNLA